VLEVAHEAHIYVLNSVNPFRLEGQKTIMIELLQQRGWKVPDRIVVPGGNLGNSASFGKGLKELYDLGFIDRMPKITIVQAHGANPLYRTMTSSEPTKLVTVHAKTLATAIQIGQPVSWRKAKRAMEWTNGWVLDVDEQAIVGRDGIGCEPAAAATIAGIKKLLEIGTDEAVDPDEDVVAVLTGHVLKDPEYTVRYHRQELYEDFVVESTVTQNSGRIKCTFANQPVRVPADKNEIISVISKFRTGSRL
jgi:threonine synthase